MNDTIVKRVTLNKSDELALKKIAEKHGCIYNKKLSISRLLYEIASGRLEITSKQSSAIKSKYPNEPLIELDIEVLSNLNGILAEITRKISDFNGNIYRAEAVENSINSHIKIDLSVPKSESLKILAKSLCDITIEKVIHFNTKDKLENLLKALDESQYSRYKATKGSKKNTKIEDYINSQNADYLNEKIVKSVVIIVGLQILLDNKPGIFTLVAQKIAKEKVSISSINMDYLPDKNQNLVNLCLGFGPIIDQVFEEIGNMESFIRRLKTIDGVRSVKQLGVDNVDCGD